MRKVHESYDFQTKSARAGIMHQLLRYASQLHVGIGLLPEKTSVARPKPGEAYNIKII